MVQFSKSTSRKIHWDVLTDAIRLSLTEFGTSRGELSGVTEGGQDVEMIQRVFESFKREFANAAGTMQKAITLSIAILMIALALAIAGGVLLFSKPWAGGTLSVAAMGTIVSLVQRVRLLARDEVMLRVIPAKYETAFQLCRSSAQYERILNDMLKEMNSLRGEAQKR